jgi:mono/diheme cytochrome c family protein
MSIARLATLLLLCGTAALAQAQPAPAFNGNYKQYWTDVCARCHGVNGNGRDNAGNPLPDNGFDFTDSRKAGRKKDSDWVRITREGKEKMPAFKDKMKDEEIQKMITDIIRPFGARH